MGGKDIINFLRINGLVGSGGGLDLEGHLVLRAIQVQEKMLPLSRHGHKTVGCLFWRGIGARKQLRRNLVSDKARYRRAVSSALD